MKNHYEIPSWVDCKEKNKENVCCYFGFEECERTCEYAISKKDDIITKDERGDLK